MKEEKKTAKKVVTQQPKEKKVKEPKKIDLIYFIIVSVLLVAAIILIVLDKCFAIDVLEINKFKGKWSNTYTYTAENVKVAYDFNMKADKTMTLVVSEDGNETKYTGTYENHGDLAVINLKDASNQDLPEYVLHLNKDEMCLNQKKCETPYIKSTSKKNRDFSDKKEAKKYTEKEIADAIKGSKKEVKYDNNKEDQVVITLFHGETCPHCLEFKEFIKKLDKKTKAKIVLHTYEVWNNEGNANLMQVVSDIKADNVGGVPYIIIGSTGKSFSGYADSMNKEIKEEIEKAYKNKDFKAVIDTLK